MTRRRKTEPRRIGGAVARVLGELGHGPAADALAVAEWWETAVGSDLAAHAEPVALEGGVLEVRADSSVWSHHLTLRSEEVLRELARRLGDRAPRRLRVHVG